MDKTNLAVGSVVGYAVSVLFNSLLVLAKETGKGVEEWLVSTFGHHWVGHGMLVITVFVLGTLVGMGFYKGTELTERLSSKLTAVVIIFTLLGVVIIAGFNATRL